MNEELKFLDSERVKELWNFIKTELAKKAGMSDLADYISSDEFDDALADALANYPTKTEVNSALAGAISREVVDVLPSVSEGKTNVIYFIPTTGGTENQNVKDEYMLINDQWEKIGTTRIDLSNYWSKDSLRAMTASELEAILV